MRHLENEVARVAFNGAVEMHSSISRLCRLIRDNPSVLQPFRDADGGVRDILSSQGFRLYPTVKRTTLFYDPSTDCFFKILHPLSLKNRFFFLVTERAKYVHDISERLLSGGVKTARVPAYGSFKKGRLPFFAVKRVEGESLYDILIRGRRNIAMSGYRKVIEEISRLHSLGYWLGDAHLSHVFIRDGEVSGIIDIDGIRKNRPFRLSNLAKDIAGFNHPGVPLTGDGKKSLFEYYAGMQKIKNRKKFLRMVKYYTERRWKD